MRTIRILASFAVLACLLSCKPDNTTPVTPEQPEQPEQPVQPEQPKDPTPQPSAPTVKYWTVNESKTMNHINLTKKTVSGVVEYGMVTTGNDPYFFFESLTERNPVDSCILSFEYQATADIPMQVFYCTPSASEAKSRKVSLTSSSSWKAASLIVYFDSQDFGWGESGHSIRFDLGSQSGVSFSIRKAHLRGANTAEKNSIDNELKKRTDKERVQNALKSYLESSYSSTVTKVEVSADKVTIEGLAPAGGAELVEITPYEDVTDLRFSRRHDVSSSFSVSVDRFVESGSYQYDRVQSRWALVQKVSDSEDKLISHAHYADVIPCGTPSTEVVMKSKKGLGGYFGHDVQVKDLDDLQISSVTVNITPNNFFYKSSISNGIAHTYCGKTYYAKESEIAKYDALMTKCQEKGIVVSAIILIQRSASDVMVGRDVVHPDCNGGSYSMPSFRTQDGVQTYGAMLDFLAKRYNPADGSHGSIHNWIMHNEIDAANEWTNMGTGVAEAVVEHEYVKSMRLCHNIVRQYYPYARVMASFAHTWTKCDNSTGFTSRSMLDRLVRYSSCEGDFEWGLAMHPYPQSLLEPCIWSKDTDATYSMDSGYVTFKNLEVLDKWVKTPANMYKGSVKRALWLSENGTNSRSYSDVDLANQAAGAAWAMKKVYALDGIDGIQWHNWYDHPTEAQQGLHIGLRNTSLEAKPVWYVYQAAGTAQEASVFDQYLPVIGISSWDEIFHRDF